MLPSGLATAILDGHFGGYFLAHFLFITLEDEDGLLNVIVRPDVYARYRRVIRGAVLLLMKAWVMRCGPCSLR